MKSVKWATLLRESAALQTLLVLALLAAAGLAEHHEKHSKKNGDHVEHHSKKNGDHVEHHSKKNGDHVEHHKAGHGDHEEEYEALETRLNKLTARLQHIEDELDHRFDPELKITALSFEHRIEELEEDHCDEDHYDCGPIDHECVSKLFVCDGTKDCRNGDDEKHCEAPIHDGDVFQGEVVFDRCGLVQPEDKHITFVLQTVKKFNFFTPILRVKAKFELAFKDKYERTAYSNPTKGYYSFATSSLVLLAPTGVSHGLVCRFDGHDFDQCVGETITEGSRQVCAKYIYFRQKPGHE